MRQRSVALPPFRRGFSIHSEVAVRGEDREGLERLVYYCARPALSPARLEYSEKAKIVIYRTEKKEGYPAMLAMSPVEFLRRWGLLMPPANKNTVHYYGALAPRSPLRALLVASTEKAAAELNRKKKLSAVKEGMLGKARSWAACLARIFEIYPLVCPNCRIELKPVAVILDDKELVRLLSHLGLPDELPKIKPAPKTCGPPDEGCQLCPGADLYDDISPPLPED
ncbi:MAG TPA: transposase [Elusimicrobiales bacterium]|nr:transposase [Elusimicrobiales bacterium]